MATQNINIVISSTGGVTVVRNLQQIAQAATNTIGPLKLMERTLHAVYATLGIRQIMEWADAWTAAVNKVNVFAKSQAETNVVIERLYEIAQRVRQPLGEMVTLYHRLSIGAKELGVSSNQNLKFTELVGKALAVQGTSANQARGALVQLSQAMGMGRIRAQEWNSMIENLPLLLVTAAKHIDEAGGSVSRLRKMMLDGRLSSKMFYDAIMKGDAELSAMHEKTNKTFNQGMVVMVNAIEKYLGGINESLGVSNKFFNLMLLIGSNLDTIGKLLVIVGVGVATAFVPTIVTAFATALGGAALALGRITALLYANPFVILAVAVAAVYAFGDAWDAGLDSMTTVKDVLVALVQVITESIGGIGDVLLGMWNAIVSDAQIAYETITGATAGATGQWTQVYADFFADTGTGFAGLLRSIAKTLDAIGGLITGLIIGIARALGGLPDIFTNVFKQAYNSVAFWIEKSLGIVVTGINNIRKMLGQDLISTVKFEQMKVDDQVFNKYGERIAQSINDGFDAQGGYMQKKVEALFGRAQGIAAKRAAATPAAGVNLDEFSVIANGGAGGKGGKSRVKKMVDEYGDLIRAIEQKTAATKMELSQDMNLTEGQKFALTIMEKLRVGTLKLSDVQKMVLTGKLEEMLLSEQLSNSRQEELKATERANKERQAELDKIKEKAVAIEDELRVQLDKNASIGLTAEAMAALVEQRDLDTASVMESMAIRQLDKNLDYEKYDAIMRQVKAIRDLSAAKAEGGRKQTAFDEAKVATAEWQKFYDSLYNGLTDNLYRAFEQGKGFFRSFWDGVKNTFKTTVLKVAIQGVVGGVAGMLGLPSPSSAGGALASGGSLLSSGSSMLSNLSNLSSLFSGGGIGTTMAGMLGSGISSIFGATAGNAALGGALGLGSSSATAAAIAAAQAGGATLTAGATTLASTMGSLGSSLAAAAGPIGLAIAGVALLSGFMSKGEKRAGGTYGASGTGGAHLVHGPSGGPINDAGVRSAIDATVLTINTIFGAVGSSSKLNSFHAGLETSDKGRGGVMAGGYLSNGRLFGESGTGSNYGGNYYEGNSTRSPDAQTAMANFQLDLKQSVIQAMQAATDIPQAVMRLVQGVDAEGLSSEAVDALLKVIDDTVAAVTGFREALKLLPFENLKNLSFDAAANMITMAGGLDNLSKMLDSYYQNFTTEEEKRAAVVNRMVATLNANGVGVTASSFDSGGSLSTRDQFKALTESVAPGSALHVALLSINDAFASITPSAVTATAGISEVMKTLEEEAKMMQIELMRATGRNDAADAAQRAFDTVGFTEAEMALYDYNTELRKRIDLYKEEQDALAATVSKFRGFAADLRSFRDSLSLSELSPLTPTQRYAEATAQFNQVSLATETGTPAEREAAMGKLQGAAQAFLEASRVVNASGGGYVADFGRVQDVLSRAAIYASATADIAQIQVDVARTQLIALGDINASVTAMDGTLRDYLATQNSFDGFGSAPPSQLPTTLYTGEGPVEGANNADAAIISELRMLRKTVEELKAQQPGLTGAIITGNRNASLEAANIVVTSQSRAEWTSTNNAPALT